jgi:hypothetical protein
MNNAAAALYFVDQFDQTTEPAAAIPSIFGWMNNLFAQRGTGGFLSDKANSSMGMRGRLCVQTILLLGEGALILVFANSSTLSGSIIIMVLLSVGSSRRGFDLRYRRRLPVQVAECSFSVLQGYLGPLNALAVLALIFVGPLQTGRQAAHLVGGVVSFPIAVWSDLV